MTESHDFSLLALFLQADLVVKAVMLALAAASFAVWAILLDKSFRLRRLQREMAAFDAAGRAGQGQAPASGLGRQVLQAGAALRFDPDEDRLTRKERLREAMRLALADAMQPLELGLPFLATVGSAAPFVGLFGTVWGIMNSFTAIARSNNTSLAVVAPGIAEALLATAIGLAAAIPAVMAYNRFVVAGARLADALSAARRTPVPAEG